MVWLHFFSLSLFFCWKKKHSADSHHAKQCFFFVSVQRRECWNHIAISGNRVPMAKRIMMGNTTREITIQYFGMQIFNVSNVFYICALVFFSIWVARSIVFFSRYGIVTKCERSAVILAEQSFFLYIFRYGRL